MAVILMAPAYADTLHLGEDGGIYTAPDVDPDGSGVVNAGDLAILKSFFFKPPGPSGLVP